MHAENEGGPFARYTTDSMHSRRGWCWYLVSGTCHLVSVTQQHREQHHSRSIWERPAGSIRRSCWRSQNDWSPQDHTLEDDWSKTSDRITLILDLPRSIGDLASAWPRKTVDIHQGFPSGKFRSALSAHSAFPPQPTTAPPLEPLEPRSPATTLNPQSSLCCLTRCGLVATRLPVVIRSLSLFYGFSQTVRRYFKSDL